MDDDINQQGFDELSLSSQETYYDGDGNDDSWDDDDSVQETESQEADDSGEDPENGDGDEWEQEEENGGHECSGEGTEISDDADSVGEVPEPTEEGVHVFDKLSTEISDDADSFEDGWAVRVHWPCIGGFVCAGPIFGLKADGLSLSVLG